MYSPTLGRFFSTDPIGFAAGDVNLYRYVGNDPLNRTDPSGLDSIPLGIPGNDNNPATALPGPVVTNQNPLSGLPGRSQLPLEHSPITPEYPVAPPPREVNPERPPPRPTATSIGPVPNVKLTELGGFFQTVSGALIGTTPQEYMRQFPQRAMTLTALPGGYGSLGTDGTRVAGSSHTFFQITPMTDVAGAGGAKPCILVLIVTSQGPGWVNGAAFHFSPDDDVMATLLKYNWRPGSRALIAGGDDTYPSQGIFGDVLATIDGKLRMPFQVADSAHILVGPDGRFYHGPRDPRPR